MDIITSNPFRILGVFSNASKKDIVGSENKIKAYVRIGREIGFKSDFIEFVGSLERNEESLANAVSQLTLAKDKIRHALFWFIKDSALDDVAFNHLADNSSDSACQIWRKKDSMSSFVNLAVCSLVKGQWASALFFYSQLIETGAYNLFVKAIEGEEVTITQKEIVGLITSNLIDSFPDVNWLLFTYSKSITIADEHVCINDLLLNSTLTKALKNAYVAKIIDKINQAISVADKTNRKRPTLCLLAAKKLARTSSDFKILKTVMDCTNIQYTSLSDKVADTLDSLCKGYYNNSTAYNSARIIQPLIKAAYSFACSEGCKANCQEGVDFIESKVAKLPPEIIERECKQLDSLLSNFIKEKNNAMLLTCVKSCRDVLDTIKGKVGGTNSEYLKQSTMVASLAMHTIIDEVNKTQKAYNDAPQYNDTSELSAYKDSLRWAKTIIDILATFAMNNDCREWFNKNRATLNSLYSQNCSPRPIPLPTPQPVAFHQPTYYPTSSHQNTASKKNSPGFDESNIGCVLFIIAFIIAFVILLTVVNPSLSSSSSSLCDEDTTVCDSFVYAVDVVEDSDYYYDAYSDNNYDTASAMSQDEIWLQTYKGNSLSTGATPYRSKYGNNSKIGHASLKITAPIGYDVLVMVKNEYDEVVKHAYIKAEQTYTFTLRGGTYQPFFVYGNSWCPEKEAPNGELGYFLEDISISKDYPQEIDDYQELHYTLQVTQNGNFQAASSNAYEAF